jgi:hypothetical protein
MILEFEFEGYVSLNSIYSSPHWSVRSRIKKEWRQRLLDAILQKKEGTLTELIEEFEEINVKEIHLSLGVHNRLDIDNNVMIAKFLMDMLQEPTAKTKDSDIKLRLIKNDGPKIYTELHIYADPNLPKNTGKVTLEIIEDNPKLF